MNKTFWAIIAVIVVIFGGILLFNRNKADAPNSNGAQPSSHVMGDGASSVTLVEYGDYQCPACGSYYPLVKQVMDKYNQQIFFQFRNLPLTSLHPNAFSAARAAEAASLQGKFWEMHDVLYENQDAWSTSNNVQAIFEQYAAQLGLNLDQFKKDYASSAVSDTINADIAEFTKTGEPKGTPAFFLDGKRIKPDSLDAFSKLIDEAIQAKQQQ